MYMLFVRFYEAVQYEDLRASLMTQLWPDGLFPEGVTLYMCWD